MEFLPCENFRDVGKALDSLNQQKRSPVQMKIGKIFRGGLIDYSSPEFLRYPKTVCTPNLHPLTEHDKF